jgi:hypothetical protein
MFKHPFFYGKSYTIREEAAKKKKHCTAGKTAKVELT